MKSLVQDEVTDGVKSYSVSFLKESVINLHASDTSEYIISKGLECGYCLQLTDMKSNHMEKLRFHSHSFF